MLVPMGSGAELLQRLSALAHESGESESAFCEAAGIDRRTISQLRTRLKKGDAEASISIGSFEAIARKTGRRILWLRNGQGPEHEPTETGASLRDQVVEFAVARGAPRPFAEGYWKDHAANTGWVTRGLGALVDEVVAAYDPKPPKLEIAAADQDGFDADPKPPRKR